MVVIELNVPYSEKNLVKKLGAKWHSELKKWFITDNMDQKLFYRWLPEEILASKRLEEKVINSNDTGSQAQPYSLSFLVNEVKNIIIKKYNSSIWLIAEISEFKIYNKNLFLTLVEYDNQGTLLTRVRAVIWNYTNIINEFVAATNIELKAGIKILGFATVDYHLQYGLTLVITSIDPSYTIGESQAKLLKIKQQLIAEGIFFNNTKLPLPDDFTKIAVVSPKDAAGLGDFKQDALILHDYLICSFDYYTAVFQGIDTVNSITTVLANILNSEQHYDAIVIIRGGGASSDLTWLNDYLIAKTICLSPIPILCGIGHNRDQTIIDQVVRQSFDTPSKVIGFLINYIGTTAEQVINNFEFMQHYFYNLYLSYSKDLQNILENIKSHIAHSLHHMHKTLDQELLALQPLTNQYVKSLSELLESIMQQILCLSPDAILKRGFTIAYSNEPHKIVLTSKELAEQYSQLILKFYDGEIKYDKKG